MRIILTLILSLFSNNLSFASKDCDDCLNKIAIISKNNEIRDKRIIIKIMTDFERINKIKSSILSEVKNNSLNNYVLKINKEKNSNKYEFNLDKLRSNNEINACEKCNKNEPKKDIGALCEKECSK